MPRDWTTIHRFDCATHLGGQGGAKPFLDDLEKQVRSAPKQEARILKSAFRTEMLHDIATTTSVHGRSGSSLKQGAYGKVRSRRPVVLWCFHFFNTTRVHLTMKWVVSLSILRPFGPLPVNTMLRAGAHA